MGSDSCEDSTEIGSCSYKNRGKVYFLVRVAWSKCDGLGVKKLGFRFRLYLKLPLRHWTIHILSLDLSLQICEVGEMGSLAFSQLHGLRLPGRCTLPG